MKITDGIKTMTYVISGTKICILTSFLFLHAVADFNHESCRVVLCENKLSFQHAVEISMIPEFSIPEADCLSKYTTVSVENYFAVYCPEYHFCGRDLQPEFTGKAGYGFNQSATCHLFAKNRKQCQELTDELRKMG